MIEIARHIEILLLDNDCVIVPGLGGFMAHAVGARYDAKEQLFLPPCRVLGFNPLLRINDSLLAQSYVEAYDLSYPEALRRIESEVSELQQHLANEGSYMLSNVGLLTVNDEGHTSFEPCEAGVLTPSLYGLSTLEVETLEERSSAAEPHATKKALSVPSGFAAGSHVADEDAAEALGETSTDEKAIVIRLSWVRNAVAIAAAVALFLIMATPLSNSEQASRELSAVPVPAMPRMETRGTLQLPTEMHRDKALSVPSGFAAGSHDSAEATNQAAQEVHSDKASRLSSDIAAGSRVAAEASQDESTDYYCIVLASYVTQRNAEDYVGKMHGDGFGESRVIDHRNIRRVVYGSYASEQEAQKELRELRRSHYFEEAWVYHVK